MVWWPFATKPERADTSEVTDLHSGAPPLYSTVSPLFFALGSLRLKIRAAACHFKKLKSRALSILTFCCMPLLLNHWA